MTGALRGRAGRGGEGGGRRHISLTICCWEGLSVLLGRPVCVAVKACLCCCEGLSGSVDSLLAELEARGQGTPGGTTAVSDESARRIPWHQLSVVGKCPLHQLFIFQRMNRNAITHTRTHCLNVMT